MENIDELYNDIRESIILCDTPKIISNLNKLDKICDDEPESTIIDKIYFHLLLIRNEFILSDEKLLSKIQKILNKSLRSC